MFPKTIGKTNTQIHKKKKGRRLSKCFYMTKMFMSKFPDVSGCGLVANENEG